MLTAEDLAQIQAMIDAAPRVGEGFADPVVAGTQLVIPAINSPNYVLNVSGWAIRRNGTAQFTGVVIIGGTLTGTNFIINSSGAFFYSGTPAAGNLILSIAPVGGTDSFGNTYFPVLSIGNQAGQHASIDASGNIFVANSSDVLVTEIASSSGALLIYKPAGIAAGNLQTSISPVASTDGPGNAYPVGITQYDSTRLTLYANLFSAALTFNDTVNAAFGAARIGLSSLVATNDSLQLLGPLSLSTDLTPNVLLIRSAAGGNARFLVSNSSLQLGSPVNTPVANLNGPQVFLNSGQLSYVSGTTGSGGDANTYDMARLTLRTSGGTVSSTSFNTIGGFTKAVVAAAYKFRAHLIYVGNGTGTVGNALFKVISPAFTDGGLNLVGLANGPLVSVRFDNASGFGGSLAAPSLAAGDTTTRYDVVIEGSAVFTAAGTLAVQAAIQGAGTAQFVIARGSTFTIEPVIAT
jgi:hypothetical protein